MLTGSRIGYSADPAEEGYSSCYQVGHLVAGGAPCPSMIPIGNPTSCSARTAQAPTAIKREMPSPGKALRTVPLLQNDVSTYCIYITLIVIYCIYIYTHRHIEFIFIYIYMCIWTFLKMSVFFNENYLIKFRAIFLAEKGTSFREYVWKEMSIHMV